MIRAPDVVTWYTSRQDRTTLAVILSAFAAVAVIFTILPHTALESALGLIIPSTSSGDTVRDTLLAHHRVLLTLLIAAMVVAFWVLPRAATIIWHIVDRLSRVDTRAFLVGLFMLVIFSRLLLIDQMLPIVPGEDSGHYYQIANTLLDEGRFIEYASHPNEPDGNRAYRLPGYPVALSAVMWFLGQAPRVAVFLNIGWMCLLVASIYYLVRAISSEGAARATAVLCAVYPALLTASLTAMSTVQFTALLALGGYLLFGIPGGLLRAFAGGVVMGMATLTRGHGFIILAALLVVYHLFHSREFLDRYNIVWRRRDIGLRLGVIIVAFVLTLAPWIVRNRIVLGEWVALGTNGGVNMWIGHHPGGDGLLRSGEFPPIPPTLNEAEKANYAARAALRYWLDEPVENIRISLRIVTTIAKVDNGALPLIFDEMPPASDTFRYRAYVVLFGLTNLAYYGAWALVAIWGVARSLGKWATTSRPGILVFLAVVQIAAYAPFLAWSRYKIPSLPFLVAAAALIFIDIASPQADASRERMPGRLSPVHQIS